MDLPCSIPRFNPVELSALQIHLSLLKESKPKHCSMYCVIMALYNFSKPSAFLYLHPLLVRVNIDLPPCCLNKNSISKSQYKKWEQKPKLITWHLESALLLSKVKSHPVLTSTSLCSLFPTSLDSLGIQISVSLCLEYKQ